MRITCYRNVLFIFLMAFGFSLGAQAVETETTETQEYENMQNSNENYDQYKQTAITAVGIVAAITIVALPFIYRWNRQQGGAKPGQGGSSSKPHKGPHMPKPFKDALRGGRQAVNSLGQAARQAAKDGEGALGKMADNFVHAADKLGKRGQE
jgi:hypothetical protein